MQIGIKTICVLLGASFMLSVAGCGKQPEEPKSSETKNNVPVTTSSESATDASAAPSSGGDEDLKDYNRAFCVEYDKMFINYNKKYDTSVEAFSHGFYCISKFVSKDSKERDCVPVLVCYDDEVFGKPFDGKLDDIFNIYNNGDIFKAASCSIAVSGVPYNMNDEVVLIETDSSEKVNINGIDTIHFTGHATYNKSSDEILNIYITGYTFIYNEKPYMLAGIIFGDKDGEDLRQEMDKEIDCMMKTVRSEKIKEGITID